MKKSIAAGMLLAVAVLAGCGKDGVNTSNGQVTQEATLSRVSDVTGAENRRDLLGRKIVLERVTATSVVGDVTFWVGEANNTLLVVKGSELRHQGDEGRIRAGHHYRITGVVRLVENVDRNDPTWRLVDDKEWIAIRNGIVYVESQTITPVN